MCLNELLNQRTTKIVNKVFTNTNNEYNFNLKLISD